MTKHQPPVWQAWCPTGQSRLLWRRPRDAQQCYDIISATPHSAQYFCSRSFAADDTFLTTQVWLRQRAPDPHLPAARYRVTGRRSRRGPPRRIGRRPVMCDRQRGKHAAVAVRGRFCAVLTITTSGLPDRPDWRAGARLSRTFRIARLHDRPLHNRVGSQPDRISIHRRRAQNARFCLCELVAVRARERGEVHGRRRR